MSCEIGNVDDGQAVAVTWRETSGGAALADGDDYRVDQGTVVGGVQESQLTIKAGKMTSFADADSFTYLCSAQSSQYDSSPASRDFDVVANVLTFGKLRFFVQSERFIYFSKNLHSGYEINGNAYRCSDMDSYTFFMLSIKIRKLSVLL